MARKVTHKPTLEQIVPNLKGLTRKQERFCQLYCTREDLSQTQCAIEAGYHPNSADVTASKMLNGRDFPYIVERIKEIKQELAVKYEVTFENHVGMLAKIRDMALADKQYTAAISAEKSRGQAAGLYIDRKEILTGKIDQMSRDEVEAEIAKILGQYPELRSVAPAMIELPRQEYTVDNESREPTMASLELEDEGDGGLDEN